MAVVNILLVLSSAHRNHGTKLDICATLLHHRALGRHQSGDKNIIMSGNDLPDSEAWHEDLFPPREAFEDDKKVRAQRRSACIVCQTDRQLPVPVPSVLISEFLPRSLVSVTCTDVIRAAQHCRALHLAQIQCHHV